MNFFASRIFHSTFDESFVIAVVFGLVSWISMITAALIGWNKRPPERPASAANKVITMLVAGGLGAIIGGVTFRISRIGGPAMGPSLAVGLGLIMVLIAALASYRLSHKR